MSETVEVEAPNGETIEVPLTFERGDLSAWYGSVPDEFEVDRIFLYDGVLRVERQDVDEWVEVGYFTEDDFRPGTETGWVAETLDVEPDEGSIEVGDTLWSREEQGGESR